MKLEVKLVSENLAHARGGEVVLYKRGDSARWQARYKLKGLKWHRTATKHVNLQYAAEVACVGAANAAAATTLLHIRLGFVAGRNLSHVFAFDNTLQKYNWSKK